MPLSVLRRLYHRLPRPPSTNYLFRTIKSPYDFLASKEPLIFDIGAKDNRGAYAFGTPPPGARLVCVDIEANPGVDLVADAHDMHMVADDSVDCVVTISTLEHVKYPAKVVREIYRVLKPGGVVYINVPFVFAYHADPDDFYRFSHNGIRYLCEDFEEIERGFNRGPASTMCDLLVRFSAILFSFNNRSLYSLNLDLFRWLLFWIKYLDAFLARYETAYVIHSGAYFLGRKPAR